MQFTIIRSISGLWLALFALMLAGSDANAQTPILCGQTIASSISAAAEVDQYTYGGSAGETLAIGFVGGDNCGFGFNATMDFYNPVGQKIASLTHCGTRSINLTLTNSGTFTILVHDDDYAQTSTYALSIQSFTGGGCSSLPIVCGQTISTNTISRASEIDAYSYVGNAGETLAIGFVGGDNCGFGFNATMDFYNPVGQKIASLTHCGTRWINLTLTNSGTFTILVHDDDYAQTSTYALSIQSFTGGGCSSLPIVCGQTISTNTISRASEIDAYSYVGNAGETLAIGFVGGDNCGFGFNATMDFYNPAGQKIASLTHCGTRWINLTLTNSGTFTILVHDDDYAQTSTYALSIQSFTGGGCSSLPIVCGQTTSTNIISSAQIRAHSFSASASPTVILGFSGFGGAQFDLYDPAGTKLFTRTPGTSTNITLTTDGDYTLLVHDDNYTDTGSYSFSATCIGGCIYTLSPSGVSVGPGATNGSFNVSVGSGCVWTATSNANWLTITSGASGSGNGTVSYTVSANPSLTPRSSSLTVAGQSFPITQAGAFNVVGQNIGNPGAPGSFSYANGLFMITGSGEDIQGTADDFYFVHQLLTGDGQIVARVTSVTAANQAAEVGVMIREVLDAGSKHAFLPLDTKTNLVFRRRLTAGAFSLETPTVETNRTWLRLMRKGDTFIGHSSTNGVDWQYVWFTSLSMSNQVHIGMAVTAHQYSQIATATFDNVSISTLTPLTGVWPLPAPKILLGGEIWEASEFARVGGFKMLVGGEVGDYFTIRSSADVSTPFSSWTILGTVTNELGVVDFLDPQALRTPLRFYRAQRAGP